VDVLFQSVAETVAANAFGVILTGMGSDGAKGLKAMRDSGARTIGQNKETCVVYGMPRVAHEKGAVELQLPITEIGQALKKTFRK
jgi:two-component system chemotaxis response regulator CheB